MNDKENELVQLFKLSIVQPFIKIEKYKVPIKKQISCISIKNNAEKMMTNISL